MLLRQMQYFAAVVEAHSFTEAAERLYISQSAVSQQISALERELGVKLLERGNRSFTLTAAGETSTLTARTCSPRRTRSCARRAASPPGTSGCG